MEDLENRFSQDSRVVAEIAATVESVRDTLRDLPEIESFDISAAAGDYLRVSVSARGGIDLRPLIWELARQQGWALRELTRTRQSLEDIFIHLTRRQKGQGR